MRTNKSMLTSKKRGRRCSIVKSRPRNGEIFITTAASAERTWSDKSLASVWNEGTIFSTIRCGWKSFETPTAYKNVAKQSVKASWQHNNLHSVVRERTLDVADVRTSASLSSSSALKQSHIDVFTVSGLTTSQISGNRFATDQRTRQDPSRAVSNTVDKI